jgi:elongation factor 2
MYQKLTQVIDSVNVVISQYDVPDMGELLCEPAQGLVAFGSGFDQWGFTVTQFAEKYADAMGMEMTKLRDMLWGDWFYNKKKKTFTNEQYNKKGKPRKRTFCKFILEPIIKLTNTVFEGTLDQVKELCAKLGVNLSNDQWKLEQGRKLAKAIMQKWLNASEAILEMVVLKLPSPRAAQKYRVKYLYEGPQTDEIAKHISDCKSDGKLCMFISKMFPTKDFSRFRAFGRVFSGTIGTGMRVRIQGGQYVPGKKHDMYIKGIQRTILMMGGKEEPIKDVPCGNTCALIGIDDVIKKQATIVNEDMEDCHNIRMMKYTVSPVVRVAVHAKNPSELPKLVEGLAKLSKSDPLVIVSQDKATGQHVIAGCGDLHVEICLKDLRELYSKGIDIIVDDPVVSYCETVTEESSMVCLSKSPNKQNRLWCKAKPLPNQLGLDIIDGKCGPNSTLDSKANIKYFVTEYGWDKNDAAKIWDYGPIGCGPNLICDTTKGVAYLSDIKDSITSAFQDVCSEGVCCAEEMRNVQWNLLDAKLHNDSIHRGGGQIIPTARRVMYASQMKASPRLLEPVFMAEITCPTSNMSGCYKCLNQRRGEIVEEVEVQGSPLQ